MSENIPESIPTSADRRSHRPVKKSRTANTASGQQSAQVEALFANPDREINTSGPKARQALAPPEIVANVQGSSAGAGSGEFHVYKASRRREYERLRLMDEEVEKEEKDREFEERREKTKKEDEEKLSKNQARRAKAKARKEKAKDGGEQVASATEVDAGKENDGPVKRKLGAAKAALPRDNANGGDAGDAEKTNGNANGAEEAAAGDGGGITFHDDD